MKKHKRILTACLAVGVALAFAGCGRSEQVAQVPQPQVVQQAAPAAAGQPVIVNAAPAQSGGGMGDMLMGGAIGYLLGSSGNRSAPVHEERRVTNVTNVTKHYHVTEAPKPAAAAQAATPAATPAPAPAKPAYAPTYANKPAAPTASYSPSYASKSSASSSSSSSSWSRPSSSSYSSMSRSSSSSFSSGRR